MLVGSVNSIVGIIKYHRSYYYLLSGHTHSNLIVTALKVFLLLWLPRECIDSVQTSNPMKGEDKISSIYHNPKRMPVTCSSSEPSSIWTTTTNAVNQKTQSTCQITCNLRASSSTRERQIRFIAGRFEKRSVWGSGQESCLVWMVPLLKICSFWSPWRGQWHRRKRINMDIPRNSSLYHQNLGSFHAARSHEEDMCRATSIVVRTTISRKV